jgi:hypothetical protein
VTSDACRNLSQDPLLVTFDGDGNIDWVIKEHQPDFTVSHVHYDDPSSWMDETLDRCIVFRNPDQPEAIALMDELTSRHPNLYRSEVTNRAGGSLVGIMAPVIVIPNDVDRNRQPD